MGGQEKLSVPGMYTVTKLYIKVITVRPINMHSMPGRACPTQVLHYTRLVFRR